ncbi:uncharacterized protein LOC129274772 [Lytechinus pictus]|uniref:uncharacterized protein LOC129274772 n=1 Tax=Lytechinus pictus TaxID=7653 RepID=UPI0030B9FA4B
MMAFQVHSSWISLLLGCVLVVLYSSLHCEAQCSIPAARFEASSKLQSVFSPNYPDEYPEDTTCAWLINSPSGSSRIQLRVIKEDFSCCCNNDYLLIKDGANSTARSIAILCSDQNPVAVTSSGHALYGEFQSDGDGNIGLGYEIQFDYFDSTVSCPTGWIERLGYCYKLYNEPLPWQQAASRCGYDGGFLTSIVNPEENDFILGSFKDETSLSWIGMNSTGNWLDGLNSEFYNNFQGELPSTSQCSAIDLSNNGRWTVSDCLNQQLTFICKKTKDGSGGRYWTEIVTTDENGGNVTPYGAIAGIIFAMFFCWMVCCCSGARDNWLITKTLSCILEKISDCFRCIGHSVRTCLSCRCLRRGTTDEGIEARRANPEFRFSVSVDNIRSSTRMSSSSESGDRSIRMSVISQSSSPPTYGDVTSEPPPPAYSEAFDPVFDISHSDVGGSRLSLNMGEVAAAPSYESVVGSESNI